jgi:hypothetical protein
MVVDPASAEFRQERVDVFTCACVIAVVCAGSIDTPFDKVKKFYQFW